MSHATDGELHAYLDGALSSIDPVRADRLRIHLQGCSDCMSRLDDARALHARAGEILADAELGPVEVPPFEAILERGARGDDPGDADGEGSVDGPTPIRRARPPLAWAASIAVALGAGWIAHATWTGMRLDDFAGAPMARSPALLDARGPEGAESQTRGSNLGFEEDEATVSSEARDFAAGSPERSDATELSDDAPGASGAAFDESEPRLENRAVQPTDTGEESVRVGVSELAIPSGRLDAIVTTGAVRGAGDRDDRERAREPVPEGVERPAEANEELRDLRKTDRDAATEKAEQDALAEREARVAQDTPVSIRLRGAVVGEAEAARRQLAGAPGELRQSELTFRARLLGGQLSWLPVSREDAEHWIGGQVFEVSGLDPAALAISTLGPVRLVRAVQTLPGGETLELFQEALATGEATGAGGVLAAAPPGFEADYARASSPVLVVERSGFRITGRAQVAADSLASLLSRLR